MDLGDPISYEALEQGTPVYSSDGVEIGRVAHVLAVEQEDVFDGIVIADESGSLEHGHRFADADNVGAIHERGVTLKLDAAACQGLPKPSANPAVMREDPSQPPSHGLQGKLERAWDLISGKY